MITTLDEEVESAESSVETPTAERVIAECAPRVYRLARWRVGMAEDAEDITGLVFPQFVRKLHTFGGEIAFSTWLNRVVANEALELRAGCWPGPTRSIG